jgi:hypothetical protein
MTDRELERRLRAWYQAEVDDDHEAAPQELRETVRTIPVSVGTTRRRVARRGGFTLLAAAALLVAGGMLAGGAGLFRSTAVVSPNPSQSAVQPSDPSPLVSQPVTPAPSGTPRPETTPLRTPIPPPPGELAAGFRWTGGPTSIPPTPGSPTALETATLLEDGRVLITAVCSAAAEIYDPVTDTSTRTGDLVAVRAFKTATRLLDGRVLFTGGYNCGPAGQDQTVASAEVYDPATGTFTATGPMHDRRQFHTATLLLDGRVLVAGGYASSEPTTSSIVLASVRTAETSASVLDTAEVYDPATGTFSETGTMSTFRDNHSATLLDDGRVLVAGGGGEAYASSTSADIYDPATGRFTKTDAMQTGRWLHTATLLADGRVLILGGRSPQDSVYRTAEIYDPDAAAFQDAGSMREGRQEHTATLLEDGRVLIAGGSWSDGQDWRVLSSAEMYDPGSGTFTTIGPIGTPRFSHVATRLADGRVLIVGGIDVGDIAAEPVLFGLLYQP